MKNQHETCFTEIQRLMNDRDLWKNRAKMLETDVINEIMNCEIMTKRAKALERAIKGNCYFCIYLKDSNKIPYECELKINGPVCADKNTWQFDEARFADGGEQGE